MYNGLIIVNHDIIQREMSPWDVGLSGGPRVVKNFIREDLIPEPITDYIIQVIETIGLDADYNLIYKDIEQIIEKELVKGLT